ncbi:MAG: hypothetical protein H0W61_12670 [Bacteroidetes bacterium]|nr:hypothetical protein [Bacteroidota bacterium]
MEASDYYTLQEAEELKHIYSCWINKAAHTGNGHIDILLNISVQAKRGIKGGAKTGRKYSVYFEFANTQKLAAFEFLTNNGLVPAAGTILNIHTPHTPHTPLT